MHSVATTSKGLFIKATLSSIKIALVTAKCFSVVKQRGIEESKRIKYFTNHVSSCSIINLCNKVF